MLKTKFDDTNKSNTGKMTAIINRKHQQPKNKILNQPMCENQNLTNDGIMTYCDFAIDEEAYYHVSTQLCIKNNSKKNVAIDYIQFGICRADFSDYEQNFNSVIVSGVANNEYVISQNLTSIVKIEDDTKYICWCNFGSQNNASFQYLKEFSHLRLYKL